MDRQRIREAGKAKIEWCCDVVGIDGGIPLAFAGEAIIAMHNAQATYLRWVHGVNYRGPGQMFATIVPVGTLRITMRWAGSVNQAHRLGRRNPAFHAIGEQPKPLIILAPGASLAVRPDTILTGKGAEADPGVPPIPASESEPPTPPAGLEMSPPEATWPKDVMSLRKQAKAMGVEVSDIKGKGSRQRILERLIAADAIARRAELRAAGENPSGGEDQTQTPEAP